MIQVGDYVLVTEGTFVLENGGWVGTFKKVIKIFDGETKYRLRLEDENGFKLHGNGIELTDLMKELF